MRMPISRPVRVLLACALAALILLAGARARAEAAAPAPFDTCNTADLPAPAKSPAINTVVVNGQMTSAGQEAAMVATNAQGGLKNANTTVAFRTVADPASNYDTNGRAPQYYKSGDWLGSNWQVKYWDSNSYPFYYTAVSSDLPHATNSVTGTRYSLFVPRCAGDAALRVGSSQGLYLHELVAAKAAEAGYVKGSWGSAVNSLGNQLDGTGSLSGWSMIDYWVQLARQLNKRIIWSEPGEAWKALAQSGVAQGWFTKWGSTVVPMFATNFETPASGYLMGGSRKWAALVAKTFGMPLGESVQSWHFREQPDLAQQVSSGLPKAPATNTGLPGETGLGYTLDALNRNDYLVNGTHYGNPMNNTGVNKEPGLLPTAADTRALSQFGADQGATFFQYEGVNGGYAVADRGTYGPVNDMSWPVGGSPSTFLQGVKDFSTNDLSKGSPTANAVPTTPLYQLWYSNAASHYYTTRVDSDGNPRRPNGTAAPACDPSPQSSTNGDYCYQEIAGYVATQAVAGTVPLRAYTAAGTGTYYYQVDGVTKNRTANLTTPATSVSDRGDGIVGWVSTTRAPGRQPIYWMYQDGSHLAGLSQADYFYTFDAVYERVGSLRAFYEYHDLGVAFYLFTYDAAPHVDPPAGPTDPDETDGGGNPAENEDCQFCEGDPVNTLTGALLENAPGIGVQGRGGGLGVTPVYDSTNAGKAVSSGRMGLGWVDAYDMRIVTVDADTMRVVQENGSSVEFDRDPDGAYIPASRVQATLEVDQNGRWLYTRRKEQSFTFDTGGRLLSVADLAGNVTQLTYDGAGLLTKVTEASGRYLTLTYTGSRVTTITDGAAHRVAYAYDASGYLTSVTDVLGRVTKYAYGASGQLTAITWPNGSYTTNTYSGTRVVSQTVCGSTTSPCPAASQRTTTWDYAIDTTLSGKTRTTDPAGVVTEDTYLSGNVMQRIDAYGTARATISLWTYDPDTNEVASATDGNGHTTTFTYDGAGNKLTESDPLGNVKRWEYNQYGQVTKSVAPTKYGGKESATYYTYDDPAAIAADPLTGQRRGKGLLTALGVEVLAPDGTSLGYRTTKLLHEDSDHPEDVTTTIDPLGNKQRAVYSAGGERIAQASAYATNSGGATSVQNVIRTAVDPKTGWVTSEMDAVYAAANPSARSCTTPAAGCTTFTRDAAGRELTHTDGKGTTTTTHYGYEGADYVTDGLGNKTTFTYDLFAQQTATTLADGTVLKRAYDNRGNVITRTDGGGGKVTATYDELGFPITRTDENGRTTTFEHDGMGNVVAVGAPGVTGCTAASTAKGCMVYGYDAADRRISESFHDTATPDVTTTYDADGRRATMVDGSGTSKWTYDSAGELLSSTDGGGSTLSYTYDAVGRRATMTYPGTLGIVKYAYDAAGRMISLTDFGGRISKFEYDADSRLVKSIGPSSTWTDTTAYDARGEVQQVYSTGAGGGGYNAQLTYAYDGMGSVQSETPSMNSSVGMTLGQPMIGLAYDTRRRLSNGPSGLSMWDAAGHLTMHGTLTPTGTGPVLHQSYDAAGQITSLGGTQATFTYDARGNRLTGGAQGHETAAYTWDQAGQLLTAQPASGQPVQTYGYDGDGLRVKQTVNGTTTRLVWDNSSELPLSVADGTWAFIYGPDGMPFEQVNKGTAAALWLHRDRQGSTRFLTDATGKLVGTQAYDQYGATVQTAGTTSPLGYTGQYTDAATGLIFLRARYYDPATAQFLSADPMADSTGSPYGYAGEDPANAWDPSGLDLIYGLKDQDGVYYYIGRTRDSETFNKRLQSHMRTGRFMNNGTCSYTFLAENVPHNLAPALEQLFMVLAGTRGSRGETVTVGGQQLKINQRWEMSPERFAKVEDDLADWMEGKGIWSTLKSVTSARLNANTTAGKQMTDNYMDVYRANARPHAKETVGGAHFVFNHLGAGAIRGPGAGGMPR